MLVSKDDMANKLSEKKEEAEVMSEEPYLAVVHVGKCPALLHFLKLSKAVNCRAHPAAHKARKNKCKHLGTHNNSFKEQEAYSFLTMSSCIPIPYPWPPSSAWNPS